MDVYLLSIQNKPQPFQFSYEALMDKLHNISHQEINMLMNFCNSKECITLKLLKVDESTWINPDNMVKYSTNFLNSWADKSLVIS